MAIEVSIICNTYNHEKYIGDALQGFVCQNTTFDYEVLVHDDCSTDRTAEIIREYEEKYPELIKPIYQKENQYSKKVAITRDIQLPRAKGRYIAICEGDDYWVDSNKLQMQYDALEKRKDCDMCAHAAEEVDGISGEHIKWIKPAADECILPLEAVIKGGGAYLATASLFYRKEIDTNPREFRRIYSLDYTLQVAGAIRGGIYYISKPMSIYRSMTPTSWTRQMRKNSKLKIAHKRKVRSVLKLLNRETEYKYDLYLKWQIVKNVIITALLQAKSIFE